MITTYEVMCGLIYILYIKEKKNHNAEVGYKFLLEMDMSRFASCMSQWSAQATGNR